jgi:maltose alpha-D-glucosyltransferase/alpha-amylase
MLQSFGFATEIALRRELESGMLRQENLPVMRHWGQFWTRWVSATFLRSYLEVAEQGTFLPRTRQELELLSKIYLLERNIYSLAHELQKRPDCIEIALNQMMQTLNSPEFQ